MLTMVGLGPPLERDEPLAAGTAAYLDEESVPESQERTLVGLPAAPEPPAVETVEEPEEAPNDATTMMESDDEVTVVRNAPNEWIAPRSDFRTEQPETVAPEAAVAELEAAEPEALVPEVAVAELEAAELEAVQREAAELVEPEPELRIFAPSLDSFVPPRRFSRGRVVIALNVLGIAAGVGAVAWVLATRPAPSSASRANVPVVRETSAPYIPREALAPVAATPAFSAAPATEVVSVDDLDVKPKTTKTQPISVGAPVVPVDLDEPAEPAKAGSGTLTITSTPPCNVVLDGRPLGPTPHTISVSAGPHSVVFIHPSKGRKSMQVDAAAGKTAVASVTF
jgi:hypothetical protein